MKKILLTIFLTLTILSGAAITANAEMTNQELVDKLYDMGKEYGITQADKVKLERYFKSYPVTIEQENMIIDNAKEVVSIFENSEAKKLKDLSAKDLTKVQSIITETAANIEVNVKFSNTSASVYKEGKLIYVASQENTGKLAYTGNSINYELIALSSIIFLGVLIILKNRKTLNV